jgi:hypothetical protein
MQLEEFYDYKNQLMEDLLTSETIVELLETEAPIQDPSALAYTRVFPCEYIPETIDAGYTYICFDVDVQKSVNKTYLLPTLYVWVFSHRSRLRLPDGGGIRTDKICSEICKLINGSRKYGLGELELYSVRRFAPLTDYNGKVMTFYAKDFNRPHNPNQEFPANRKKG